jgi:YD repeat-containing protein
MIDGVGTTSWTYDVLSRETSVTHPDGGKVKYTYNAFGHIDTLTTHLDAADLTGKTITYGHDADGRLSTITDWQSHTTEYSYDALGRVQTVQHSNGIVTSYTYDLAGHLTDLVHSQGALTLAAYHYAYDPVGNPVSATELVMAASTTPLTQLTALEQGYMAIRLGWPDSTIEETGYRLERSTDDMQHWQSIVELSANTLRYIDNGLLRHTRYWYRLTPFNGQGDGAAQEVAAETGMQPVIYTAEELHSVSISYSYDALNRLTLANYDDGTAFSYTYDAAGNTLQLDKTIAGQTSTTVYTYDVANQLTSAQEGSATAWQYHYDGNGSLVEMTPGATTGNGAKRYSYNTAGQLVRVETHDGTAYQPQAEMVYDGQGQHDRRRLLVMSFRLAQEGV